MLDWFRDNKDALVAIATIANPFVVMIRQRETRLGLRATDRSPLDLDRPHNHPQAQRDMRVFLVIVALSVIWIAAIVLMALIISDGPLDLRWR